MHEVARTLGSHERLGTLLRYIRDWNTNARFCHIAQAALKAVVEVRAPHVPDLTIIDLPGIVRTATAGQDMSVVTQVNSTIEKYLGQDRTIILAIVPANQDVATVDILERALRVDPTLRAHGLESVWALGDWSSVANPRLMDELAMLFREADAGGSGALSRAEFRALLAKAAERVPSASMHLQRMSSALDALDAHCRVQSFQFKSCWEKQT